MSCAKATGLKGFIRLSMMTWKPDPFGARAASSWRSSQPVRYGREASGKKERIKRNDISESFWLLSISTQAHLTAAILACETRATSKAELSNHGPIKHHPCSIPFHTPKAKDGCDAARENPNVNFTRNIICTYAQVHRHKVFAKARCSQYTSYAKYTWNIEYSMIHTPSTIV